MNVRDFSDDLLIKETRKAVQEERDITLKVLRHLREVERRRLFSKLKYKSLHEFAVKELCYSDSQATRRITTMRLLLEIPELENKLSTGATNLTNVVMANTHFNNEQKTLGRKLTKEEKFEVLSKIERLSIRAAEKVVVQLSSCPATLFSDKVRTLSEEYSEVKFAADQELLEKLETIKGLLAHKMPNATTRELLHELCDIAIIKLSPGLRKTRPSQGKRSTQRLTGAEVSQAEMLRQMWQRDQSKCTNCGSKYAPQQDHRIPRAKGGQDTLENSRLLCRNCNQRAAIEEFGLGKMGQFLKSPTAKYQPAKLRDQQKSQVSALAPKSVVEFAPGCLVYSGYPYEMTQI